jgi:hypothetical protein
MPPSLSHRAARLAGLLAFTTAAAACAAQATGAAPAGDRGADTIAATHRAAAAEVVALIGVQQSVATVPAQVATSIAEQIDALGVPEERRALVADYMSRLDALMAEGLAWETLAADFALLYAETFPEAELRALAAFFASEAGRRYVAQTPSLTRQSTLLVEQHVQQLQPRIEALLVELQGALRDAAGPPPASGAAAPATPPAAGGGAAPETPAAP